MYPAGSTGLNAAMPPSALEGGYQALFKRLRDPAERAKIRTAMVTPTDEWENLYLAAGSAERVLLVDFKNEKLKPLTGQDARGGGERAREGPVRHDSRSHPRGRVARRRRLFPDVGREHQKQLKRRGSRSDRTPRRWRPRACFSSHPRIHARTATSHGCSASTCAQDGCITIEEAIRRVTSLPAAQSRPRRSRQTAARPLCRRRRLRSRDQAGSRDVREAASAGGRRSARVRQRRAGAEGRRADRKAGGRACAARARGERVTIRAPGT